MGWYNEIGPIESKSGTLQTPNIDLAKSGGLPTPAPQAPSGGGLDADTITQLLKTGTQIAGTVTQQRQASGKSAERQARIEACGRKGLGYLFSRRKRADYQKCVDDVNKSYKGGSGTKSNVPSATTEEPQSNTMLYVGILVAVLAISGVGYYVTQRNN